MGPGTFLTSFCFSSRLSSRSSALCSGSLFRSASYWRWLFSLCRLNRSATLTREVISFMALSKRKQGSHCSSQRTEHERKSKRGKNKENKEQGDRQVLRFPILEWPSPPTFLTFFYAPIYCQGYALRRYENWESLWWSAPFLCLLVESKKEL